MCVCLRETQTEKEGDIVDTSWACNKTIFQVHFQIHIAAYCVFPDTHTYTCRPCSTSSKHLSGQLVFQTNRIYLMTRAWHWGNIGGLTRGGGRNWLLGFKSISLAKHKPEEMGSLLCAFTVVCCCCWELTRACMSLYGTRVHFVCTDRRGSGPAWPTVTHLSDRKENILSD